MEYIIIKDSSEYQLMLDVTQALKDGWKLAGGLAVCTFSSGALFFAQALYK